MSEKTTVQRLIQIRDDLERILKQQKSILALKHVTPPDNITLDEVPNYTKMIEVSDITFMIDFSLIDQVGTPHAPLVGQITGGFDYEFGINISLDTSHLITMDFSTTYPILNAGRRGQITRGMTIEPEANLNNNGIINFDFNELEQVPEVLNYVDQVY